MIWSMGEGVVIDRRGGAGPVLSASTARRFPSPGDEGASAWLLDAAFVGAVASLHLFLIAITQFHALDAFPLSRQPARADAAITIFVARVLSLLPAVALLRWLQRRYGLFGGDGSVARVAGALAVAAAAEWALFLAGVALADAWLGGDAMAIVPAHPYGLAYRVLVLGVGMLVFAVGAQWRRVRSLELRAAEAEVALRTSELTRLEAQLQPHFLFNALTAVLACRHDPEAVAKVTIGLSEHLRSCLARRPTLAPLGEEIDALEHYLAVQRARFGKQLECRIECSAEARDVPVPPVVIEPLLDNALKHGSRSSPDPLRIVIDGRIEGETLVVTVENSGAWIEPDVDGRTGIGLANLRKRLELLGVPEARLEIGPVAGGVRARLRLPSTLPPIDSTASPAAAGGGAR